MSTEFILICVRFFVRKRDAAYAVAGIEEIIPQS